MKVRYGGTLVKPHSKHLPPTTGWVQVHAFGLVIIVTQILEKGEVIVAIDPELGNNLRIVDQSSNSLQIYNTIQVTKR